MTAALDAPERDASEPDAATPAAVRTAQLLRTAALLLAGIFIAFTAVYHELLAFDAIVLFWALLLLGIVTCVEYWVLRGTPESWWIAARAVVAFGASGALTAVTDSLGVALVLATWAVLTGVVTSLRLARKVQPRKVALPSLLLSFALAAAVLLVRHDPVAIIGFFGSYAVVRGVFLGIAAFDPRSNAEASASDNALEPGTDNPKHSVTAAGLSSETTDKAEH